jgi:spore maturation protein CgeB
MKKYGFEGKKLGDVLTGFKEYITKEYQSYNDYIIYTDKKEIFDEFETYLNEQEIRKAE